MNKLKTLIKRITYKLNDEFDKIKKSLILSRKHGKTFFHVYKDIRKSKKKYGATVKDYYLFDFILLNEREKQSYFTAGCSEKLIKKFNSDKESLEVFENKLLFSLKFKKYLKRNFLSNKEMTFNDFKNSFKNNEYIFYKTEEGNSGKGAEKIHLDNLETKFKYCKSLPHGILEEVITQRKELNSLYPGSVNTIRIATINHKNTCHIVYHSLKIGNGGIVDNFHENGMIATIDKNGIVCTNAFDLKRNEYEVHPITGAKINGFKIPEWEEIIILVKEIFDTVPGAGYIGWDIAVTEKGPVVIEGNATYPGHEGRELPHLKSKKGHKHLIEQFIRN